MLTVGDVDCDVVISSLHLTSLPHLTFFRNKHSDNSIRNTNLPMRLEKLYCDHRQKLRCVDSGVDR